MKSLCFLIREYMINHLGTYLNQHKVEFNYDRDIIVTCLFPGYVKKEKNILLELVSNNATIGGFIQKFGITSVVDLSSINKEFLYKLYVEDKAELCCYIDGDIVKPLYFQKRDKVTYARDENDNEHYVPFSLQTPDDYINYTKNYFQRLEDRKQVFNLN